MKKKFTLVQDFSTFIWNLKCLLSMALEHEIFQKKYYKHLFEFLKLHVIGKPDKHTYFQIYQPGQIMLQGLYMTHPI